MIPFASAWSLAAILVLCGALAVLLAGAVAWQRAVAAAVASGIVADPQH